MDEQVVLLGGLETEHIAIRVLHLDEERWVHARVAVRAGGFSGLVEGTFWLQELEGLLAEVTGLQTQLAGAVDFAAMEDWLEIRLSGNGHGGIAAAGWVRDGGAVGNTLHFSLASVDQTHLLGFVRALRSAIARLTNS